MVAFLRARINSFKPALEGWWFVLRTQQNAWLHAFITVVVFLLAWWLHLDRNDWALLLLTTGLVWLAEFINTALEALVDLASPGSHPLAKTGKDIGAAAVLIAALCAVLVGLLVLGSPLLARLNALL
ncbi:MAG: diacylglycerol kinase family protein [Chloroflexi bacterium]|nr:diacylglycerol kinase family protein [Chloroflexota bacterium]